LLTRLATNSHCDWKLENMFWLIPRQKNGRSTYHSPMRKCCPSLFIVIEHLTKSYGWRADAASMAQPPPRQCAPVRVIFAVPLIRPPINTATPSLLSSTHAANHPTSVLVGLGISRSQSGSCGCARLLKNMVFGSFVALFIVS
jgi:hypothetical protein